MKSVIHAPLRLIVSVASLASAQAMLLLPDLGAASPGDLGIYGGACYGCAESDVECGDGVDKVCEETGFGTWVEAVGSGITQRFCADAKGQLGKDVCNSVNMQDCVSVFECVDEQCNDCGEETVEKKPTQCQAGGNFCNEGS